MPAKLLPASTTQLSPKKQLRRTSKPRIILEMAVLDRDAIIQWPVPIARALTELTPKQRHFAVCRASGLPLVEAYRRAYDVADDRNISGLMSDASQLADHPKIALSIDLVENWLDTQWLLESQDAIEFALSNLYEDASTATKASDRIAATTAIMRYHGAFVSRSEVRHVHTVDTGALRDLVSDIGSMIGLAVPITPPIKEIASVDSIEVSFDEIPVPLSIGFGTPETD